MRTLRPGLSRVVAALALILTLSAAPSAAAPTLLHLHGIAELKSWFNANHGHPRLILLLSPT